MCSIQALIRAGGSSILNISSDLDMHVLVLVASRDGLIARG
jgi:hypothetical protein